ncbi:hypothetical protein K523DRAFT_381191, partial [Schizophyllum commune Tattone D]
SALWGRCFYSVIPQDLPLPHPFSLPLCRNVSPRRAWPVRVPTALVNSRCWARRGTHISTLLGQDGLEGIEGLRALGRVLAIAQVHARWPARDRVTAVTRVSFDHHQHHLCRVSCARPPFRLRLSPPAPSLPQVPASPLRRTSRWLALAPTCRALTTNP